MKQFSKYGFFLLSWLLATFSLSLQAQTQTQTLPTKAQVRDEIKQLNQLPGDQSDVEVTTPTPINFKQDEVMGKPLIDEGSFLRFKRINIELGLNYNYSFVGFPHGTTILTRVSVVFNDIHEFGVGAFLTSYYKEDFLVPNYANEIRAAAVYRVNLTKGFLVVNHTFQLGPGFLLKGEKYEANNSIFFYLHPEFDFEFWFTRFFSLSIPVGYVLNIFNIDGDKVNTSHLNGGMIWRWRI